MRIRFTRLALSDLREAEAFIRARDATAAAPLTRRIETTIRRLEVFPESGRSGRVPGTRELVVPPTTFVVAYRLTTDSIDISCGGACSATLAVELRRPLSVLVSV